MGNHHAANGHTIRLTSAWEPPSARGGAWVRRFGRPTGIAQGDRVMLVIDAPAMAAVAINETPLPAPPLGTPRWTHDITPLLDERNELVIAPDPACDTAVVDTIDVHGRAPLPSRHGIVALQILTLPAADR